MTTATFPSSKRRTQRSPLGDWKATLLDNPDLFIAHYFADRIGNGLEDFHLRLLDTAVNKSRSLTLYPAGHGKTTLISEICPILAMCRDPNVRVVVVAKNDDEAAGIMRSIQHELVSNEKLIEDFGPFYEKDHKWAWSIGRLSIVNRERGGKSDTLAVFGSGAKTILGYRSDWTICDDVVTAENSATFEQRNKLRSWYNKSVATGPEHWDSRITVVGTRFEPEDLYQDIIDLRSPETDEPIYDVNREDAVVDNEQKVTLWPSQWPWHRLMEKKAELGVLDFNKRYRNIAVDESRQVFKEEYIRGGWIGEEKYSGCVDREYEIGVYDESWPRFTGFDPAIGTKQAKFSALITIARGSCKEHESCYWVVDLHRAQMTAPHQRDLIFQELEKYSPAVCMIETNGYQAGLYQIIKEKMEEQNKSWNVEPHFTSRGNKPDPVLGVESMAPWFQNGKFHIPFGNAHSREKIQVFIDELIGYPGKTTDTVLACWFAWRAAQQHQALNTKAYNRLANNGQRYHKRTFGRTVKNPYFLQPSEESDVA